MGRHGRFLGSDEERRHTHKRAEGLYIHTCLHAMGSHCKLVCKLWSLKIRIIQKLLVRLPLPSQVALLLEEPWLGSLQPQQRKTQEVGPPFGGHWQAVQEEWDELQYLTGVG